MTNWPKILVLPLILLTSLAQAAVLERVEGFYSGAADVESRSESARQQALQESLVGVLVRMTGDVSVSLRVEATDLIMQAQRYVRSYRYVLADAQAPGGARQQRLQVDFDPAALKQAVKQAGLPVWDDRRPLTAVWLLAPGDTGPREIQPRARIEEELPLLAEAARRRGLPLRFPLMDEEDFGAISSYDIIAQDYVRIEAASQRYQSRHMLLLRLQPQAGSWEVYWSFLREEQEPLVWRSSGEDANIALARGFDFYADQLAQLYAVEVDAGWVQGLRLRVVGLDQLSGYARVLNYLEGLNLVDSVMPVEVMDGDVVFELKYEGTQADLERTIDLGGLLEPAPEAVPTFEFAAPVNEALVFDAQGNSSAEALLPAEELQPTPTPTPTPASMPEASPTPAQTLVDAWTTENTAVEPAADSGLSFFAVQRQPELRYQLRR